MASPNAVSAGHCAPPASGTGRPSHEHTCQRYNARPSISLARLSASTIGPTPDIDTGGNAPIATCVVRVGLDGRAIGGVYGATVELVRRGGRYLRLPERNCFSRSLRGALS